MVYENVISILHYAQSILSKHSDGGADNDDDDDDDVVDDQMEVD